MILFQCDYNEGAHPRVMEKLMETNLEQTVGYGEDEHCAHAAELIRKACGNESLAVHFLVGGTQANMTVIAAALRPHQGVIAAQTGHINCHETGAVESTGHKVLALPHKDGKISAAQVERLCREHREDASFEHTVQPKMVYISNPTEYGTLYTAKSWKSSARRAAGTAFTSSWTARAWATALRRRTMNWSFRSSPPAAMYFTSEAPRSALSSEKLWSCRTMS